MARTTQVVSFGLRAFGAACCAVAVHGGCSLNEPALLVPDADAGGAGGATPVEGGFRTGGSSGSGARGGSSGAGGANGGKGGAPSGGDAGRPATGGSAPSMDAGGDADASIGSGCTAPLDDCNGQAGDGCETNTSKDVHHCGACNHDCLGGACLFGECQPVRLADRQVPALQLADDGANVYWSAGDRVVRAMPAGGGPVRTVAVSPDSIDDVATDGEYVYWVTGNVFEGLPTVRRAKVDGGDAGTPEILYQGVNSGPIVEIMSSVAADAQYVYWSVFDRDTGGAAYYKRAKSGGSAQRVFPSSGYEPKAFSSTLTVSGKSLYAGGGGGGAWVLGMATNGSSFERLFDTMTDGGQDGYVDAVAVSGDELYFTRILSGVLFGPFALGLYSVPVAGGAVKRLATDGIGGIAVDATYVYYTTRDEIARVAVAGGLTHVLAANHPGGELVMDAHAIYWDEAGGSSDAGAATAVDSVWMLAK